MISCKRDEVILEGPAEELMAEVMCILNVMNNVVKDHPIYSKICDEPTMLEVAIRLEAIAKSKNIGQDAESKYPKPISTNVPSRQVKTKS